ncbi:hypothetical protein J4210_02080 [Candidatus Woesearchaeota archaeon]|nr:hypothetical protein [Candidatus Woesearchaeota archaeon]
MSYSVLHKWTMTGLAALIVGCSSPQVIAPLPNENAQQYAARVCSDYDRVEKIKATYQGVKRFGTPRRNADALIHGLSIEGGAEMRLDLFAYERPMLQLDLRSKQRGVFAEYHLVFPDINDGNNARLLVKIESDPPQEYQVKNQQKVLELADILLEPACLVLKATEYRTWNE